MTLRLYSACLSALALFLPMNAARAADLDMPVYADQVPEYTPVEVGSGWYLRGDVAYGVGEAFNDDRDANGHYRLGSLDLDTSENHFAGSAGIGYHWTDYFRTDINGGYIAGDKLEIDADDGASSARAKLKNDAWYAMGNAYVDLGTIVGLTPYVGAGAGVLSNRAGWKGDYAFAGEDPFSESWKNRDYAFAYTLDAGLAYRFTDNLSVDLGYQYFSSPDAEYIDVNDPEHRRLRDGLDFHQIRVGLRYDLW